MKPSQLSGGLAGGVPDRGWPFGGGNRRGRRAGRGLWAGVGCAFSRRLGGK